MGNAANDAWRAAIKGKRTGNVGKSRVEMGKGGGGGAEQMKIKKLCLEEATEEGEKNGAGWETRLRMRMRGAEAPRESR